MAAVVTCGSCDRVLDEDPSLPAESRPPCPVCGSTSRSSNVTASSGSVVSAKVLSEVSVTHLRSTNLLLQAVVTLGPKTNEGHIIEAVAPL